MDFNPTGLRSIEAIKRRLRKERIPISKDGSGQNRIFTRQIRNCALASNYDIETTIRITQHDLWVAQIKEEELSTRLERALGLPPIYEVRPAPNASQDFVISYIYDFMESRKKHRAIIEVVRC